jgi:APA family basic amino acid/polyamine antiporter
MWRRIFQRKSLETLLAEMAGEHRLRRVLGPVSLTALGVGAIIGAGIFAITGRVAAEDAGPGIMISFVVAGFACAFAALCYAEFAAMAPVAGSAYTYTYATLGEVWAWIIGWDLILEYAMSCSVVASHWSNYFNEFLRLTCDLLHINRWSIAPQFMSDYFTPVDVGGGHLVQAYFNLPAIVIMGLITIILVLGIRESANTNAVLVFVKTAVVIFVIALGIHYVNTDNWTKVPVERRRVSDAMDYVDRHPDIKRQLPAGSVTVTTTGEGLLKAHPEIANGLNAVQTEEIRRLPNELKKWGLLGAFGIKDWLKPLDEACRSPFLPYGFSGLMAGAALVFFAYIGFDSISTHSEEAIRPQRDVPIGILVSLGLCTVLYILMAGVITGMEPYWQIDTGAAVAAAFRKRAEIEKSPLLQGSAWIIATGALAGMTSVLLVIFLSQARVFLAMARDGLLPHSIFGVVHERFRTPHRSTMLTGAFIALTAGFLPVRLLEEMVNIGTLLAFVLVCASVLVLRISRPNAERPFRCPALFVVAPLGILVNLAMMMFLPLDTWIRLAVWLALGLVIYFLYGLHHSTLGRNLVREMQLHGATGSDAPLQ